MDTSASSPGRPDRALSSRGALVVAAALLAAALVTWIVLVERMRGMDMGPSTDLGGFGWYVGVWVTMTAAMMLPSAAPMVLFFARVSEGRARRGQASVPTWLFVAGYLVVWTAFGLAAYGVARAIHGLDASALAWDEGGRIAAGAAIAAAGLYQLTPLKQVCLRHCRSPLHYVLHGWREGHLGALRMGAEHGGYCVGCCIGLMAILFALGLMSILWMAVVAAVIFAEKVLPFGERLSPVLAVAFLGLGILVAVSPGRVPGLMA